MTPDAITAYLRDRFSDAVMVSPPDAWQVDTPELRLLVLLSQDGSWLRALTPLMPLGEAQPFLHQILGANFDLTQAVRYGCHEEVLWGVFHHDVHTLAVTDLATAIDQLIQLKAGGIDPFFNALLDSQLRQIIEAAKSQGQSLEATLKTLDRFYSEGMMGDMGEDPAYQAQALAAWQRQLERLWPHINPPLED